MKEFVIAIGLFLLMFLALTFALQQITGWCVCDVEIPYMPKLYSYSGW